MGRGPGTLAPDNTSPVRRKHRHTSDESDRYFPHHDLDISGQMDIYIPDLYDLYDLYALCDLAHHVAGLEPYDLYDLAHVSWVGSVRYRSCTTPHNGGLGSK